MKLYEESYSGWTTRSAMPPAGGIEIVDGNGWALAVLNYDYRYTCNATNHFRANLFAGAPELLEAAQAVIARWETPAWKDAGPTAEVIHRLKSLVKNGS